MYCPQHRSIVVLPGKPSTNKRLALSSMPDKPLFHSHIEAYVCLVHASRHYSASACLCCYTTPRSLFALSTSARSFAYCVPATPRGCLRVWHRPRQEYNCRVLVPPRPCLHAVSVQDIDGDDAAVSLAVERVAVQEAYSTVGWCLQLPLAGHVELQQLPLLTLRILRIL
jgi:hypothetical protein